MTGRGKIYLNPLRPNALAALASATVADVRRDLTESHRSPSPRIRRICILICRHSSQAARRAARAGTPLRALDARKESGVPDKELTSCFAGHALFRNDGYWKYTRHEGRQGDVRDHIFLSLQIKSRRAPSGPFQVVKLSANYFAAARLAFTMPAPKNDVWPVPPVQRRGSSDGQSIGHESLVAVARIKAATVP